MKVSKLWTLAGNELFMIQNSKKYSTDYNWDKWSRNFLQIFQHIIFISNSLFTFAVYNISLCGVNTNQATGILLGIVGSPERS